MNMNFVENNGKKVAAVLCVASAFPVVATVVAAKEEAGWHGDKYVTEDNTVATGWQEIEGESYYFTEDGSVDTTKSEKAVTASVSSSVVGDVQETVATTTTEEVQTQETVKAEEEAKAQEEAAAQAAAIQAALAAQETTNTESTESETPETTTDEELTDNTSDTTTDELTGAGEEGTYVAPTETATPTEETYVAPTTETTTTEEVYVAPVETTTTTETTATATSNIGERIAAAAQNYVGTYQGWCTELVQKALADAGVSDAYQLWPDQYAAQYGYYVSASEAQAGDLIYYNNGGRGADHIAVYVGNGQAVHGNYGNGSSSGNGIVYQTNATGGDSGCSASAANYIRVVR